tara:strand:- start:277 stop:471 length:195 start_codon:yes stop_codon:yes gene_type:complete
MGNMSYCRFENTMNDLKDCLRHIAEDAENLRDEESRWEMIQMFHEIAEDFNGDVVEYAHNQYHA